MLKKLWAKLMGTEGVTYGPSKFSHMHPVIEPPTKYRREELYQSIDKNADIILGVNPVVCSGLVDMNKLTEIAQENIRKNWQELLDMSDHPQKDYSTEEPNITKRNGIS